MFWTCPTDSRFVCSFLAIVSKRIANMFALLMEVRVGWLIPGPMPKPGAYRCTPSSTTLALGESPGGLHDDDMSDLHECRGPMVEYVLGSRDECQQTFNVVKWIKVRGPAVVPPDHASGFADSVSKIWHLLQSHFQTLEDRDKAKADHEKQKAQVEKVKQIQVGRWGADHAKMKELDRWADEKFEKAREHEAGLEKGLLAAEKEVAECVNTLLAQLRGEDNVDPECAKLLEEVEDMFSSLSLETPSHDSGMMDATSHALSKVDVLPDGPEKSALCAVLQVATTSPQVG